MRANSSALRFSGLHRSIHMAQTTWSLTVNEEGFLELPSELLAITGWTEDTILEWDVSPEGTISLRVPESESGQCTTEPHEQT